MNVEVYIVTAEHVHKCYMLPMVSVLCVKPRHFRLTLHADPSNGTILKRRENPSGAAKLLRSMVFFHFLRSHPGTLQKQKL